MSSYTIFHSTNVSMLILPIGKLYTTGTFSSGFSDFLKYIMNKTKVGNRASLQNPRSVWIKIRFLYEEITDYLQARLFCP